MNRFIILHERKQKFYKERLHTNLLGKFNVATNKHTNQSLKFAIVKIPLRCNKIWNIFHIH